MMEAISYSYALEQRCLIPFPISCQLGYLERLDDKWSSLQGRIPYIISENQPGVFRHSDSNG